jgi:hypothetical protein
MLYKMLVSLFTILANQFALASLLTDWLKISTTINVLNGCRLYKGTGFSFVRDYCDMNVWTEILTDMGISTLPYLVYSCMQVTYYFTCLSVFLKFYLPENNRTIMHVDILTAALSSASLAFYQDLVTSQHKFHNLNSELRSAGFNMQLACLIFTLLSITMKYISFNYNNRTKYTKLIYE